MFHQSWLAHRIIWVNCRSITAFMNSLKPVSQRCHDYDFVISSRALSEFFFCTVLSAGLLIAGFLGGVLLTTVFLKSSWILDQVNLSKKRSVTNFVS